jgi:hypothetical protein
MPFQNTTLTALLARLALRYESAPFWAQPSAIFALNEALRLWNLLTGMARLSANIQTIVDNPYLDLTTASTGIAQPQWLKITRVRRAAALQELNPVSLAGLDAAFPGWEAQTTVTARVSSVPRYWAPAGAGRLAIYPKDTSIGAGGNGPRTLIIDAISCANVLVNGGDFLDLGDDELNVLVGYALHVLSFSKGTTALAQTRPLYLAFLKAAAERNAIFAASSFYRKIIGQDWTRLAYPLRSPSALATAAALTGEAADGSQTGGATPARSVGPDAA